MPCYFSFVVLNWSRVEKSDTIWLYVILIDSKWVELKSLTIPVITKLSHTDLCDELKTTLWSDWLNCFASTSCFMSAGPWHGLSPCHAVTHPVTLSLMTSHNQPALNKKISDFCPPYPIGDNILALLGTQGVAMSVSLVQLCLKFSVFIFIFRIFKMFSQLLPLLYVFSKQAELKPPPR